MNDVKKLEQVPAALTTTAGGVARMLNVSTRQVFRLSKIGKLPKPVRFGKCVRWRIEEIRDFVKAGCPCRDEWEQQRHYTEGRGGI